MAMLKAVFTKGDKTEVSYETFKEEMAAIFFHYRHSQDIIDRIVCYLKIADKEQVTAERINTLVEFLLCYPTVVKKNKNASIGMGQVMTNEETHAYQHITPHTPRTQTDQDYVE
jgi:hypothetical protein